MSKSYWPLALFALLVSCAACATPPATPERPNVLFIAVDDLKPLAGIYGNTLVRTPSIDALASRSTVLTHAYIQYPVCGPSRSSMLTGLRPESNGVLDLKTRLRDVSPGIITLPQLFKQAGYETAAVGKIFDPRNVDSRQDDDPASWTIPYKLVSGKVDQKSDPNYAYRAIEARNEDFVDGQINKRGKKLLREMAAGDRPFFLGVGYKKPHLPFVVPKRFFDLYDLDEFSLAEFQSAPAYSDASYILSNNNEFRTYWPQPKAGDQPAPYGELITDLQQREVQQGYFAAVSFIDELIGELLATLEETSAAKNTIIVIWGDHGFHLGDHGMWGKHTTMEQAARHPLIIHVPGLPGGTSHSLVEALDIYPTLAGLATLDAPPGLQGTSLLPVLQDPDAVIRETAITQYKRRGTYGYSMRTDQYRYTEWVTPDGNTVYRDLYDMQADPGETRNIADLPESSELVDSLTLLLRANDAGLLRIRKGNSTP